MKKKNEFWNFFFLFVWSASERERERERERVCVCVFITFFFVFLFFGIFKVCLVSLTCWELERVFCKMEIVSLSSSSKTLQKEKVVQLPFNSLSVSLSIFLFFLFFWGSISFFVPLVHYSLVSLLLLPVCFLLFVSWKNSELFTGLIFHFVLITAFAKNP